MRIAIIGAGSWGTALGIVAARAGHEVKLWSRNAKVVESINRDHINSIYLAGFEIPNRARATTAFEEAIDRADLLILAAPSHAMRSVLTSMLPAL